MSGHNVFAVVELFVAQKDTIACGKNVNDVVGQTKVLESASKDNSVFSNNQVASKSSLDGSANVDKGNLDSLVDQKEGSNNLSSWADEIEKEEYFQEVFHENRKGRDHE